MSANEGPPAFDEPELRPDAPVSRRSPIMLGVLVLVIAVVVLEWSNIKSLIPTGGAIPWTMSMQAALAESRSNARPILVYFTAAGRPQCEQMMREVWADPAVQKLAARFIPVLIDVNMIGTMPVAEKYGIGMETVPHILVLDAGGKVVKEGAFMNRDQMLEFMETALPW